MCADHPKTFFKSPFFGYIIAAAVAVCTGLSSLSYAHTLAETIADIYMNVLKLVSIPILFLSIVNVVLEIQIQQNLRKILTLAIRYTLLTTILAAIVALVLFLVIQPVTSQQEVKMQSTVQMSASYMQHLLKTIPSNIIEPFVSNNVIGVLIIATLMAWGAQGLDLEHKKILRIGLQSIYTIFMRITRACIRFLPFALWAFLSIFIHDFTAHSDIKGLALYLICVLTANIVQATVVLPLILYMHKISPIALIRQMAPALTVAFLTKSSTATVPTAVDAAVNRANIASPVAKVIFPLCTTINMNGCAAFILITVLFVSISSGVHFSVFDMISWIFISTLAAVGNAGIPMGCYFLASAFLASMNVPLTLMGIILPFYSFIDAVETALNVWSDSAVCAIVNKKTQEKALVNNYTSDN